MRAFALLVAVVVTGCGAECDIESREGTYLVTFDLVGGTCGEVPDQVVTLGSPGGGASCEVESKEVSDDLCTMNSQVVCDDTGNGLRTYGTTSVTEENGGESAFGTMSLDIRTLPGNETVCTGTYDLTYARQ